MKKIALVLALLAFLGVAFSLRTSADPGRRFEKIVAALKAAGEPVEQADLQGDPVSDGQNAYPLLVEAEKLNDRIFEDTNFSTFLAEDAVEESPENREWRRKRLAVYDPYVAMLRDVLERPVLMLGPGPDPGEGPDTGPIHAAIHELDAMAEIDPGRVAETTRMKLRLAAIWEPRTWLECLMRWGTLIAALKVHEGSGPDLSGLESLEDLRTCLRSERVMYIWFARSVLAGRDPLGDDNLSWEDREAYLAEALQGLARVAESLAAAKDEAMLRAWAEEARESSDLGPVQLKLEVLDSLRRASSRSPR